MYNRPTKLNTTLFCLEDKGLKYIVSDPVKSIQSVVFKNDLFFKTLILNKKVFVLWLSSSEIKMLKPQTSYSLVVNYKDGTQKTINGLLIKR